MKWVFSTQWIFWQEAFIFVKNCFFSENWAFFGKIGCFFGKNWVFGRNLQVSKICKESVKFFNN